MDDVFAFGFEQGPNYTANVLNNDLNADGGALTASVSVPPQHGIVTIQANGSFQYTPTSAGFIGSDSFVYVVQDSVGTSVSAKATLTISPLAVHPVTDLQVLERSNLNAVLANVTFSSGYTAALPLTVSVAWGDGQTTAGTVSNTTTGFQLSGTHRYDKNGVYSAVLTLHDSAGGTWLATTNVTVADTPPQVSISPNFSARKGQAFQYALATFTDDADATPSQFTAQVDWGDGRQSPATITANNGTFTVMGSHLYAHRGQQPVSLTVTKTGGLTASASGQMINVTHVITVTGQTAHIDPGNSINGAVASFTSDNSQDSAEDFFAIVSWGDGTQSLGLITGEGGMFTVSGQHAYSQPGSYPIHVEVTDDDPAVGSIVVGQNLPEIPNVTLQVFGKNLVINAGEALSQSNVLAEVFETDVGGTPAAVTASINWGDGKTSNGTVNGSDGQFEVTGDHTYTSEGAYKVTITISGSGTSTLGTASILVLGKPLQGTPQTIDLTNLSYDVAHGRDPRNNALVAQFTDPSGANASYTALLDLGDGQFVSASVQRTPGASSQTLQEGSSGSATSPPAPETQLITLPSVPTGGTFTLTFGTATTDPLPSNANAAQVQAALLDLPTIAGVTVSGNPAIGFTVTFTAQQANQNVGSISANDAGLTGGAKTYDVRATVNETMPESLKVRIYKNGEPRLEIESTIQQPNSSSASSSSGDSHAPDDLKDWLDEQDDKAQPKTISPQGVTISATENESFDGNVADVAGDTEGWTAQINWGDGDQGEGTVSGGHVQGQHTYEKPGDYRITVTLRHDPPQHDSNDPNDTLYGNSYYYNSGYYYNGYYQATVYSGAIVNAKPFTLTAGTLVAGQTGERLDDQVLATGTDIGDNATAVIEWGDGTIDEGTTSETEVKGSHVYENPGEYQIRVVVRSGSHVKTVVTNSKITLPSLASGAAASLGSIAAPSTDHRTGRAGTQGWNSRAHRRGDQRHESHTYRRSASSDDQLGRWL
ncbi:MAG: Ig-like domain-containing protein [Myxococcales bacterium]